MKKKSRLAVLLVALTALLGCQPAQEFYLLNNTGVTLRVLQSASRWQDYEGKIQTRSWERSWPWPFSIPQGVGRRVEGAGWSTWLLDVRVAGCRLRYEAPMGDFYEGSEWWGIKRVGYHTTIQLERDLRLYLVATQTADISRPPAVDIAPFAKIQPDGYPVTPVSRECK